MNEEYEFWGVKGGGVPDFKNSKKTHREWWSQRTPKISAL